MATTFKTILWSIIFFIGLIAAQNAWAAAYFVDNVNGAAGNAGSYQAPFNTVAACTAAMSAAGGDTCFVRTGTYAENIDPQSGAEGKKNTYAAWQNEIVRITKQISLVSKNDIRIIGFEITGGTLYSIPVNNSLRCNILNNKIHHTANQAIRDNGTQPPGTLGARYLTVRGNTLYETGCLVDEGGAPIPGACAGAMAMVIHGDHVLIENNIIYKPGGDFLNLNVSRSIIRNNSFTDFKFSYFPDNGGTGHTDVVQWYSDDTWPSIRNIWESNWMGDNYSANSHGIQIRAAGASELIIRGNFAFRIGSYFAMLSAIDNTRMYNNTLTDMNIDPAFDDATNGAMVYYNEGEDDPLNSHNFNNIFYNASHPTKGRPIGKCTDCTLTASNNICYLSGTDSTGSCTMADPLFENYVSDVFYLQNSSPAKNTGKAISTVSCASGTGTSFVVTDAGFFSDGFGITRGDTIRVGANPPVTITQINDDTHTVTVDTPITWIEGDGIYWRNSDEHPDIGAWEYSETGYDYTVSISPKSGYVSGTVELTASVTNPVAVRFVEFWIDGLPVATDYESPYRHSWNTAGLTGAHTVKAIAYALYATPTPFKESAGRIIIGEADTTPPAAPLGLTVQ